MTAAKKTTVSVRDALAKVAADTPAQQVLTAAQIVDRVVAQPLKLNGKTPRATVQAALYTHAKKGELFEKVERGRFAPRVTA